MAGGIIADLEELLRGGLVNIQNVQVGDLVLTRNEYSGEHEYKPVIHLIQNEVLKETLWIDLSNGDVIKTTSGHLIFINDEWSDADKIQVGDTLYSLNEGVTKVVRISVSEEKVSVYNFTVDGNQNYFVGRNGVLVHNISPCEKAAKSLAQMVPKKYCGKKFVCDNFAVSFEKLLIENKVNGKRLCVKSSVYGKISSIRNKLISDNGNHFAVQVGDTVFDNMFPNGISYKEWADDIGVFEGIGINVKSEKMTGRKNGCIPR